MSKQVSFKFEDAQIDALDSIKKNLHAATQAEAIRRSINLTNALAAAEKRGIKIILENEKTGEKQQLVIG